MAEEQEFDDGLRDALKINMRTQVVMRKIMLLKTSTLLKPMNYGRSQALIDNTEDLKLALTRVHLIGLSRSSAAKDEIFILKGVSHLKAWQALVTKGELYEYCRVNVELYIHQDLKVDDDGEIVNDRFTSSLCLEILRREFTKNETSEADRLIILKRSVISFLGVSDGELAKKIKVSTQLQKLLIDRFMTTQVQAQEFAAAIFLPETIWERVLTITRNVVEKGGLAAARFFTTVKARVKAPFLQRLEEALDEMIEKKAWSMARRSQLVMFLKETIKSDKYRPASGVAPPNKKARCAESATLENADDLIDSPGNTNESRGSLALEELETFREDVLYINDDMADTVDIFDDVAGADSIDSTVDLKCDSGVAGRSDSCSDTMDGAMRGAKMIGDSVYGGLRKEVSSKYARSTSEDDALNNNTSSSFAEQLMIAEELLEQHNLLFYLTEEVWSFQPVVLKFLKEISAEKRERVIVISNCTVWNAFLHRESDSLSFKSGYVYFLQESPKVLLKAAYCKGSALLICAAATYANTWLPDLTTRIYTNFELAVKAVFRENKKAVLITKSISRDEDFIGLCKEFEIRVIV